MTATSKTTSLWLTPHRNPTHNDIAECARELWVQHGRPANLDLAIWLDAEALLRSGGSRPSTNYRELMPHASRNGGSD